MFCKWNGKPLNDGLSLFCRIKRDGVRRAMFDFTYYLKSCVDNSDIRSGRLIHAQLVTIGFESHKFAMTALCNLYGKCGQIINAYKVFDRMPERDLISWNTIVSAYAQNGFSKIALGLVIRMQEDGKRPDSITLVSISPAAVDIGDLMMGKSIHGYMLRSGFDFLVQASTALVAMYSKFRLVNESRIVFDAMRGKTVVSWNSLIRGYVQSGHHEEGLLLFRQMMDDGMEPSDVTIMEVLHACSTSRDLAQGILVHKLVEELELMSNVSVMNSLISMYCKCNDLEAAAKLFANLGENKTLVSWNAMILGYAQNGLTNEALSYFYAMQSKGEKLDSFTLVSVITAVAESSMICQAKWVHGLAIRTSFDQVAFAKTALVDMYAKCGDIEKARLLFITIEPRMRDVSTWNSMMNGYGAHGLVDNALKLFSEMQKEGIIRPNEITFQCVLSACCHGGLVEEGIAYFTSMKEHRDLVPGIAHYGTMVDLLSRAGRIEEAWGLIQKMPFEPDIQIYGSMLGGCQIHKNVEFGEKAASKLFEMEADGGGFDVLISNMYAMANMWDKVIKIRDSTKNKGIQVSPGWSLLDVLES